MIPNADFHGRYDYKCPRTRASWGCVLSVYGLNNAKKQCTYDEQCKAFTVIAHYARPGMLRVCVCVCVHALYGVTCVFLTIKYSGINKN